MINSKGLLIREKHGPGGGENTIYLFEQILLCYKEMGVRMLVVALMWQLCHN
jgi:hypothetical protein